eukprot:m.259638 g.259638  ORF g.259638 m.259638 type:complete len:238 (+) comp40426_c1_seq4:2210-2923(+)
MAQFMIPPPPPFNFDHRQLGQEWKTWKQRLLPFLEASDLDGASERKKSSLLLSLMGVEGIGIYDTFEFTDNDKISVQEGADPQIKFQAVIDKFNTYFLGKVNVTFERHLFFTRDQQQGESIDRYVTDLRKLANTCDFGQVKDSLIRDRLVCGLLNRKVREQLLTTSNLTLEKVVDRCRAAEEARKQSRAMETSQGSGAVSASEVEAVSNRLVSARKRPARINVHDVDTHTALDVVRH